MTIGRPTFAEADPYYFRYINLVVGDDPIAVMEEQFQTALPILSRISEPGSLQRYAADKWSIRQVLAHLSDAERLFAFRALWFARGSSEALPSMDPNEFANLADSDAVSWAEHVDEFRAVRTSSISLFKHLPADAWARTGIASGTPVSVRALAFIIGGHLLHHLDLLRRRYGVFVA